MQTLIKTHIEKALKDLGIEGVNFVVDHPTDKNTKADYFSNVALAAAKIAEKSPRDIAEQILKHLDGKIDQVD